MARRAGDERGLSLIELLIAITILGSGVVAVLAAMTTSLTSADVQRSLAGGEAVMRDYADAVKAKALAATTYTPCPTVAQVSPTFSEPGYAASVSGVEYWRPSASDPRTGSYTSSGATCAADAAARCAGLAAPLPSFCDAGRQRITVEVVTVGETGASETTQTGRIVVRRGKG